MSEQEPEHAAEEYDPDQVEPDAAAPGVNRLTREDLLGDTEFEPFSAEELSGEDAPVPVEPEDEPEEP